MNDGRLLAKNCENIGLAFTTTCDPAHALLIDMVLCEGGFYRLILLEWCFRLRFRTCMLSERPDETRGAGFMPFLGPIHG